MAGKVGQDRAQDGARRVEPPARKSPPKRVLHWGSEDYRPRIDG